MIGRYPSRVRIKGALLLALGCLALAACRVEAGPKTESSAEAQAGSKLRVMTWNLEWLTERSLPERARRIQKVIDQAKPDAIMFQEIESQAALQRVLPQGWKIWMADSAREDQELGFAAAPGVEFSEPGLVFTSPDLDSAFPGRRDVVRVKVRKGGREVVLYGLHLKSRAPARWTTDARRVEACQLLTRELARRKDPLVAVMGDFNDTPGDPGPRLLLSAGMVNLMEPLYQQDWTTADLEKVEWWKLRDARVPGASRENEMWRGREHNFRTDVKIKAILFDQIIVSSELAKTAGTPVIANPKDVLDGSQPRVTDGRVETEGTRASDHLPVWVDL
jgi:endonuclease/exonuclease/phosphatase family metal-dependent hydrolase